MLLLSCAGSFLLIKLMTLTVLPSCTKYTIIMVYKADIKCCVVVYLIAFMSHFRSNFSNSGL